MSGNPQLSARSWVTAITAALGSGGVVVVLALMLERPAQIAVSLRMVSTDLQKAGAIAKADKTPSAYPANAVCASSPERAASDTSRALQRLANASSLKVSSLNVAAEASTGDLGSLTPISIQVSVEGPYDGIMGFLHQVEGVRPEVFVTSTELRSHKSDASLTFQGESFCANLHPTG